MRQEYFFTRAAVWVALGISLLLAAWGGILLLEVAVLWADLPEIVRASQLGIAMSFIGTGLAASVASLVGRSLVLAAKDVSEIAAILKTAHTAPQASSGVVPGPAPQ